jgi:hypothetical protein
MQAAILGYVGSWRHARSRSSRGGVKRMTGGGAETQVVGCGCWGGKMVWVKERQWRRLAVKPTWFSSKRLGQSHSLARIDRNYSKNLRKSPSATQYNLLATSFFPVSPRYSSVTGSTFLVYALALFHNSGADLPSTLILFPTRECEKDQWGIHIVIRTHAGADPEGLPLVYYVAPYWLFPMEYTEYSECYYHLR